MLYELKSIRKASGISQNQAAAEFDVPVGTYRNWEQCLNMPRDNETMKRIASYFGVSLEALFGYDLVNPGELSNTYDSDDDRFVYTPLFGEIAAGQPIYSFEIEAHVPIPVEIIKKHRNAFLLRVVGRSMDRVLPDGCYALIDPDMREIIDGHAYALCVNGDMSTIKRVKKLENGYAVIPDSVSDPTYKQLVFDIDEYGEDYVKPIGEVVWYTVPFDYEI